MAVEALADRARDRRAQRARRAGASATTARPRGGARMSELLLLGISHKTAPVALRERVALLEGQRRAFLARAGRARRRSARRSCISTCNRTEVYLVVGDPVDAETAALGALARRAGHPPDRARRGHLLAAQLRRRAPAVPRHLGPGVDDRRRGRGAGPGQARLRGRARRGHDRAADQPPVQRRAAHRQARALRDRDRRRRRVSVSSVAVDARARRAGRPRRPPRRDHRRGRDRAS